MAYEIIITHMTLRGGKSRSLGLFVRALHNVDILQGRRHVILSNRG